MRRNRRRRRQESASEGKRQGGPQVTCRVYRDLPALDPPMERTCRLCSRLFFRIGVDLSKCVSKDDGVATSTWLESARKSLAAFTARHAWARWVQRWGVSLGSLALG